MFGDKHLLVALTPLSFRTGFRLTQNRSVFSPATQIWRTCHLIPSTKLWFYWRHIPIPSASGIANFATRFIGVFFVRATILVHIFAEAYGNWRCLTQRRYLFRRRRTCGYHDDERGVRTTSSNVKLVLDEDAGYTTELRSTNKPSGNSSVGPRCLLASGPIKGLSKYQYELITPPHYELEICTWPCRAPCSYNECRIGAMHRL